MASNRHAERGDPVDLLVIYITGVNVEFSIASYLLILALSGLSAFVSATLSDPLDHPPEWFGNLGLIVGLVCCVCVSQINQGLGFLAVLVVAAFAGGLCADGLREMKGRNTLVPAATFVLAPLLSVAAVALVLSGIYLFIAFVFAHFPLPFELPYSTVSSIFNYLFQKDFRLWDFYAFSAYFSITGSTMLGVYWQDLVALLQKLRQSPATASTAAAQRSGSGVND